MSKFAAFEQFEEYQYQDNSRENRRNRPGSPKHKQKNGSSRQPMQDIREMDDGIENWVPSYAKALDPKHHERQWVIESVGPFYRDQIVTDVTRLVKGGKE